MKAIKNPTLYLEIQKKEKNEIDAIIEHYQSGLITCPEFVAMIKRAGTKYKNIRKIINK